jgi:L-threonylcarbamoyladenylate synthase
MSQLEAIAKPLPPLMVSIVSKFWPGPLTILCKKRAKISVAVTAGSDLVAVRMPNHPLTLELLRSLTFPLVAPSANPSNRISPTTAKHVLDYFGDKIPFVLDGGSCQQGIESTIISLEHQKIVIHRPGAVSKEALEQFGVEVQYKKDQTITAPGNFSKHYAPNKPLFFTDAPHTLQEVFQHKKIGFITFYPQTSRKLSGQEFSLATTPDDFETAMRTLYSTMHQLDQSDVDLIIAERFPDTGAGSAINDRLKRAAVRQFIFEKNLIDPYELAVINR